MSHSALSRSKNSLSAAPLFGPEIEIRTCSAEDLIVLKLFASRPLDIRDAESGAVRCRD